MTSFEDYARRKTDDALNARLAGFETVLQQPVGGLVPIGNAWTRELFDGYFLRSGPHDAAGLPSVSLVFVESRDGNTSTDDPSRLGGGDTDKHLVYEGLSRVDADAVMAGATTANDEELVFSVWHPELVKLRTERGQPRHPVQVVVTARAALPIERALLYNEPSLRVIVITGGESAGRLRDRTASRPWIDVIDAGAPLSFSLAFRRLHKKGIHVVSAVGGRRTAQGLLAANLVNDIYLTTSPIDAGEPGTPLFGGPAPSCDLVLEKRGRGEESGVRFRYLRLRASQADSSSSSSG